MPQRAKGARLYQRKDTGLWIIRDTGRGDHSTGSRDRAEAEKKLAAYINQKSHRSGGPKHPDEVTIAEILNYYGSEHAPHVTDPDRIAYAIERLIEFWGVRPMSAITRASCIDYGRSRVKVVKADPVSGEALERKQIAPGTIRRELGTLIAALNFCADENLIGAPPKVHLPEKPEPKNRWLTRSEAAKLLWTAYRNPRTRHVARFIQVALYSGTRKAAILGLRFEKNKRGGFVDVEHGILFRRAAGQKETKKKTPTIRLAPRLLCHLKIWAEHGDRWVISFDGQGVVSIKSAWNTVVREANLPGVTPHCLRHTAITWACQSGKSELWELSGYFGVSMETMTTVYAHHHPNYQKNAIAAIGSK